MLQNDLYKIRQILVNESYPDYGEFDIIVLLMEVSLANEHYYARS